MQLGQDPCGDPLTRTLAESMCVSSQIWGYKTGCSRPAPDECLGHVWVACRGRWGFIVSWYYSQALGRVRSIDRRADGVG